MPGYKHIVGKLGALPEDKIVEIRDIIAADNISQEDLALLKDAINRCCDFSPDDSLDPEHEKILTQLAEIWEHKSIMLEYLLYSD